MGNDFLRYKTSSPAGDLISMLPAIRQAYRKTGKKGVILQRLNMIGIGYQGSSHPFQDDSGYDICMPLSMFNMLFPLLLEQEYIEDFIIYEGQEVDYDLDKIRMEIFTNQPQGNISRWLFYAFPDLACDLSEEWINVSNNIVQLYKKDNIIINFTERYRNRFVTYFFLKQYEDKLAFAGLPQEYERFILEWKLDMPLVKVSDFLELAECIKAAKLFLGNQSFVFQLAESLKVPRILELSQLMPNVIPCGKNAFDFYHQGAVEYYVHELFNKA